MDVLDNELLRLWKNLNDYGVRYIMIGGFAIRFQGFNRNTDDLNIWIEDTLVNRKKLRTAFDALGLGDFPMFETMQFIPGWTDFSMGGITLDIVTSMKGLEDLSFDECLNLASVAELEGIKVPFLHIDHLIANKKKVDRPKDKIDVIELEKIKALRDANRFS